jgi:integrase
MGAQMGLRPRDRLSPAAVKNLAKTEVGRKCYVSDGGGLYLQRSPGGGRSWVFRGARLGRRFEMGLGSLQDVGLAKAREKARRIRDELSVDILDYVPPLERRRAAKAAQKLSKAKVVTFQEAAEAFIASKAVGWKSIVHAKQWPASLRDHAYPVIGDLDVGAIDTGLVMKVLEPIWATKPETASRVRGRIESVLAWATVRGHRTGPNPAIWRGHLDKLLAKPSKAKEAVRRSTGRAEHHPALPYAEIGSFMVDLRQQQGAGARALEFVVLSATRAGETLGARWEEINVAERLWTIPASRMKAGREHRVPLSDAAMRVIEQMAAIRQGEFVFTGAREGRPLSQMAILMLLRRMGHTDLTVHGFRSSFRDWCAERTNFPAEVAEMALAHKVGSKVEEAYRRTDMFEKRRLLAEQWANFCDMGPDESGKVIAFGNR